MSHAPDKRDPAVVAAELRFELPSGCLLRPLEEADAPELARLVDANRAYLARWLPWAAGEHGVEPKLEFIRTTRKQLEENNGFQAAIVDGDSIVGTVGFHRIDWPNRATSIGYWIAEDAQGRGTVTEAVRVLTSYAFDVWNLHRIEIRAAAGNGKSAAIPLRLGYVREGVLREREWHEGVGGFEDLVLYSMLAPEWHR